MGGQERRAHERFVVWFPVSMSDDAGEGFAVSKNISQTGILVATGDRLEVGAKVQLQFRVLPVDDSPRTLEGTIVRTMTNDEDPHGAWPFKVAIEFAGVAPEIEALLRRARESGE